VVCYAPPFRKFDDIFKNLGSRFAHFSILPPQYGQRNHQNIFPGDTVQGAALKKEFPVSGYAVSAFQGMALVHFVSPVELFPDIGGIFPNPRIL
jgi:hypothetical protein